MSRPSISLDREKDDTTDGVLYVARLSALCLTGITFDATTDARVGKDKEHPPPPDQMRAVLAVMRDTQRHGISSRSKRLKKAKEKDDQACRHQRYIAAWNKRNSKHGDESVSFEAKLSLANQMDHNFDLVIGLTSGSSTTVTPVGIAILPIAEAVRMQNAVGAVVLDLPVFNFTSLSVDPFAKQQRNSIVPFNRVLSVRRFAPGRKPGNGQTFGQRHKKKALGYDYFIDPNGGAALLRIELEVHEKERNFEVGLDTDKQTKKDAVLKHSLDSSKDKSHPSNIEVMEPSIERVFAPVMNRRFRVEVNDGSTRTVESSPKKATMLDETFDSDPCEDEDEDEAKVWVLNAATKRVLSVRHMEDSNTSLQASETRLVPPLVPKPSLAFPHRREKSRRFNPLRPIASEHPLKPGKPIHTSPFGRFMRIGMSRTPSAGRLSNEITISETKRKLGAPSPSSCGLVDEVVSSVDGRPQSLTTVADCSKSVVSSSSSNLTMVKWVAQQKQPLQQQPKLAVSSANAKPIATKTRIPPSKCDEENASTSQSVETMEPSSVSLTESPDNNRSHASRTVTTKLSEGQRLSSSKFVPFLPQEMYDTPSVARSMTQSVLNANGENWKVEAVVDYFPIQPNDYENSRAVTPPVQALPSSSVSASPIESNDVSRYSTSLPNFSEEEQPVAIIKEKYEDTSVAAEKNVLPQESQTNIYHEGAEASKRSLRNYLSLVDIQPCVGKLNGVLQDTEGEDDTVADSWTANDNSTVQTNKPRVVSLRDDLLDFGLFLGELCRPIDARTTEENSLGESDSHQDEANKTIQSLWGNGGVKQKWMSAMNITQFLDGDDQDTFHTERTSSEGASWAEGTVNEGEESFQSASQSILSFEPTVDSFAMDKTVVSEQGTEVDVKDFKLDISEIELPREKGDIMVRSRSFSEVIKKPFFLNRSPSADPQPIFIEPSLSTENHQSPSPGLPKPLWKKSQRSDRRATLSIADPSIPSVEFPMKENSTQKRNEPFFIRPTVESNTNSGTDNRPPNDVIDTPMPVASELNLKSLARSLADLMEYAILPSPPAAPVIPQRPSASIFALPLPPSKMGQVPSLLEPDDATSVGDLTATTYEMQVDIDELKRQIEQNEQRFIMPIGRRPFGGHVTQTDNYFSDYDHEHKGASLDLYDAMEASLAKQLAEGWPGAHPKR